MFRIPVYKAEAHLKEVIQANSSVACLAPVKPAQVDENNIKHFLTEGKEKFDLEILYPTKSVLVSSTWNLNDDVFGVRELWAARHTPVHTPTNINHDHNKIVGHITDTWVIDSQGDIIGDDTVVDDLPNYIHICNGAVIYKRYKEDDLTERADELIAAIEANEKFVSMECLFPDFDYAVIAPDKNNYVIARNEDTAFLTKHLRVYGGEGEFDGYKLGRFLKHMVFSGKGYVDKPANPESVLFTDDKPKFSFSNAKHKSSFSFKNGVNNNMSDKAQVAAADVDDPKEIIMSENNEFYKTELDDAKKQISELAKANKELQESVANANVEQLNSQIDSLNSQVESLNKEKEETASQLSEANSQMETLKKTLDEVTESKNTLETEIEKVKAERVLLDRISKLVDAGVDKDKAGETASKLADLNDEQFDAILDSAKTLFPDDSESKTDDKEDDKKKKKEDSKADELDEVLEDAEVDAGGDAGAAEGDDNDDKTQKVREAVASFFESKFELAETNE